MDRKKNKTKNDQARAKAASSKLGQVFATLTQPIGTAAIRRDFVKALLFTLALLAAKSLVECSVFGKHFELMTYDLLQLKLLSSRSSEDLPVVIVDISNLETALQRDSDSPRATPREALRQLVDAIAQQQPRAIGVDIDFSPDSSGYITPLDPHFFQFCMSLKARTHIPIFLGIARSQALPSDLWLGSKDYSALASSIIIPRDSRRMLRWIQVNKNGPRGPTISTALADALQYADQPIPAWLDWLVRQGSAKRLSGDIFVSEFLIDYSSLEELERQRLRTKDPRVIFDQGWLLRDKVVIIGDATRGRVPDSFVIPGRQEPFPGVYVHACATQTLMNEPLYELTGIGRLIVDPVLVLIAFGIVVLIRLHYRDRTKEAVNSQRLQFVLNALVAVGVIVAGSALIHETRLMWDDFLLVGAVLLFHQPAEHFAEQLRKCIQKTIPPIWRRLIFDPKKEDP